VILIGGAYTVHFYCIWNIYKFRDSLSLMKKQPKCSISYILSCHLNVTLKSSPISAHICFCQTAGWIKMPLGRDVNLSPGHIVLDEYPAPPRNWHSTPTFVPCLLWPNGLINQNATWYAGRPRPSPHCVRLGPSPPRGTAPKFSAHVCCGQTAGSIKMPLGRR